MGLFDFVEQHHRIRAPTHLFSELPTLFITDISRRRTHKAAYGEFLHKLTHIHANQRIGRIKHIFGKFLCQMCLTYTRRAQEHECTYRFVRVLKPYAVTLYRLYDFIYSLILPDNVVFEFRGHFAEPAPFGLGYTLHRHTGHHRDNLGNLILINGHTVLFKHFLPLLIGFGQCRLQFLLLIAERSSLLEILRLGCSQFGSPGLYDFLLQTLYFLRHHDIGDMGTRTCLVQCIDSFVREIAVAKITFCQAHTCLKGIVGIYHIVMVLVLILDII